MSPGSVVKIKLETSFCSGIAIGKDADGNRYYVENGDLLIGKEVETVIIKANYSNLIQFHYDLDQLIKDHGDKHGLIHTKQLKELAISRPYDRIFEIESKWVCIDRTISTQVEYLLEDPELWQSARLKVSRKSRQTHISRVQTFGINFQKALRKVINSGRQISYYHCENKEDFSELGYVSDFLIILNTTKAGLVDIQCWQALDTVLVYAHGQINLEKMVFVHFDCAHHHTTIDQIIRLFKEHSRIRISNKVKFFRLDGEIKIDSCLELMRPFFPLDNLIDEYFIESHNF